MTKPLITVAGNLGNYTGGPNLAKIIYDSTNGFTAGEYLSATPPPTTPPTIPNSVIPAGVTTPYVFSFLNKMVPATANQFRVALSNYALLSNLPGIGESTYWFYDAVGDANNAWVLMGTGAQALTPPRNPHGLVNAPFGDEYLLVADYDSDGGANATGNVTVLSMDASDTYSVAGHYDFPTNGSYQAHCQDIQVVGGRIFALVIYSYTASTSPIVMNYDSSVVYELALDSSGPAVTLKSLGSVALDKNAVQIVPFTFNSTLYLFAPCIGGMQNYGSGNAANSSLAVINAGGTLSGTAQRAFIGTNNPSSLDFRGLAISSDGTAAFILVGNYDASYNMGWQVHKSSVAVLVANAGITPTPTLNSPFPWGSGSNGAGYFWALGTCRVNDNSSGDEYLVFARGTALSNAAIALDAVYLAPVASASIPLTPTIKPEDLNAGAGAAAGFAINSMAISVPGGVVTALRAALPPFIASGQFRTNAEFIEEMKKRAAKK